MTLAIHTHDLYNELIAAGLTDKQADIVVRKFVTNEQLEDVKSDFVIRTDLDSIITKIESKLDTLDSKIEISTAKMDLKIEALKSDLIRWMVGLLIMSSLLPHFLKGIIP